MLTCVKNNIKLIQKKNMKIYIKKFQNDKKYNSKNK